MDNVIQFPGTKKNTPPQSIEEINSNLDNIKGIHVQETVALIVPMLFEHMIVAGFEFDEDMTDMKLGALVVESIRSMLLEKYGIYHPLQEVAENIFKAESEGVLSIVDTINVNFKNQTGEERKS